MNAQEKETNNTNDKKYAYRTYINDLYLELPEYKHHHSSLHGHNDEVFIGREKDIRKIKDTLHYSEENGNGAYLVTGYRGMGKTSLVNKALREYKNENKKKGVLVRQINVNFSQTNLKETDILKQLIQNIIFDIERNPFIKVGNLLTLINFIVISVYGLIFYKIINTKDIHSSLLRAFTNLEKDSLIKLTLVIIFLCLTFIITKKLFLIFSKVLYSTKNLLQRHISYFTFLFNEFLINSTIAYECLYLLSVGLSFHFFGFSYFLIVVLLIGRFNVLKIFNYIYEVSIGEARLYNKLIDLLERCNANVTSENGLQNAGESFLVGFVNKRIKVYPIANSKEIENEIIMTFKEYERFKIYRKKYITVFDELDKIESIFDKSSIYSIDDSVKKLDKDELDLSNRKNVILNILSSLKFFITESKARFIFIAGREMFDAALADVADRQSIISSVFHQIIYLDSFLKDRGSINKSRGLTNLVEEYLEKILISDKMREKINYKPTKNDNYDQYLKEGSLIKTYFYYLQSTKKGESLENLKVIYTLQNFIIYLTYRSNGSPKKLVKIIEEYIESVKYTNKKQETSVFVYSNTDNPLSLTLESKRLFIRFTYKTQYKFAFLSYLYRPFILSHSQFIKQYSDNVLVSTPYLMDHIIKYHPFAFSIQNLELLPEVLSNNRNPTLRYFIEELISFLSENHLRETETGIFNYKFYNKTSNEIIYLSKIFEAESAAFNFTLNEIDYIKTYIKGKINNIETNAHYSSNQVMYIESLSFLYDLLGDLYYFDQEFDNSIINYQNGIQLLSNKDSSKTTYENFINTVKFKLKLGLINEKMKSFGTALTIYKDAIMSCLDYLKGIDSQDILNQTKKNDNKTNYDYKSNQVADLINIYSQSVIASLFLYEKLNNSGVSLNIIVHNQFQIFDAFQISKVDNYQKNKILSNYFLNIGNLLYYKNFTPNKEIDTVNYQSINSDENYSIKKTKIETLVTESFTDYNLTVDYKLEDFKSALENLPTMPIESNERKVWYNRVNDSDTVKLYKYNKDYRFSFHAFLFYKYGFSALTNYKYSSMLDMFKHCSEINYNYSNKYDKNELKAIAVYLSSIANQLLSTINTRDEKISTEGFLDEAIIEWVDNLEKISNLKIKLQNVVFKNDKELDVRELRMLISQMEEYWYTNDSIKQLLIELKVNLPEDTISISNKSIYFVKVESLLKELEKKVVKNKVKYGILSFWDKLVFNYFQKYNDLIKTDVKNDLELLINLYYLSGRFYSRAGKSVSFGFQMRKILHLIKNTVNIRSTTGNTNINNHQGKLLVLLEETILFQILEIASWNSSSTDRPQIYKFKHSQGIDTIFHPSSFAKYNYLNTSNSPEIKEAIYLFADIKLNSIDFSIYNNLKDCLKYNAELQLISPVNTISTQYSRILELDLQDKLNRVILKKVLFKKILTPELLQLFVGMNLTSSDVEPVYFWESILFSPYKRYGVDINKCALNQNQDVSSYKQRSTIIHNYTTNNFEDSKVGNPSEGFLYKDENLVNTQSQEERIEEMLWRLIDKLRMPNSDCLNSFLEYQEIIANSIFSLSQIISTIKVYEVNYYISYSYLANFHKKLGTWYKHYALCRSILRRIRERYGNSDLNHIDKYLKDLLGADSMVILDSTAQYQLALQYYHKAKQVHSNGLEYSRLTNNLIFLEDDFNDNLYHFGVALERQRMNSYHIRKRIKTLEDELIDSPLYRYDSFTNA